MVGGVAAHAGHVIPGNGQGREEGEGEYPVVFQARLPGDGQHPGRQVPLATVAPNRVGPHQNVVSLHRELVDHQMPVEKKWFVLHKRIFGTSTGGFKKACRIVELRNFYFILRK